MKIQTLLETEVGWERIWIEIQLVPGLPEITFLGNAHGTAKESAKRIKCALKSQGFELPTFQQVLVDLTPHELRKKSAGLDLAVAVAFLVVTEQIPPLPWDFAKTVVWGELSLEGKVAVCNSRISRNLTSQDVLVSAFGSEAPLGYHGLIALTQLQDLRQPLLLVEGRARAPTWEAPRDWEEWRLSQQVWDWLGPLVLGRHSGLLAGPAGVGKSTIAKIAWALQAPGTVALQESIWSESVPWVWQVEGHESVALRHWIPWQCPHHTIPRYSLIGGGSEMHGGVIAQGHRGVVLLDELFEFPTQNLETLRQIMESRKYKVQRRGREREYPIDIQWLATTNLCPCGDKTLAKIPQRCSQSLKKCNAYADRVSGPILDRFELVQFLVKSSASGFEKKDMTVEAAREKLAQVRPLRDGLVAQTRSNTKTQPALWEQDLRLMQVSERRRQACWEYTHSIAAWQGAARVESHHYLQAKTLTVDQSLRLRAWDLEL